MLPQSIGLTDYVINKLHHKNRGEYSNCEPKKASVLNNECNDEPNLKAKNHCSREKVDNPYYQKPCF
jgi:hypothetical protein